MAEELNEEEFELDSNEMDLTELEALIEAGGTVSTTLARKNQILEFFDKREKKPATTKDICGLLNINNNQCLGILKDMMDKDKTIGGVKKAGRWWWYIPKWLSK